MKSLLVLASLAITLTACAMQPYGVLYSDVTRDNTYPRPMVYKDLDIEKFNITRTWGEACSSNILGLIATGDSGYDAAVDNALKRADGGIILLDVKVDHKFTTYLGIYSKFCTKISAIAAKVKS